MKNDNRNPVAMPPRAECSSGATEWGVVAEMASHLLLEATKRLEQQAAHQYFLIHAWTGSIGNLLDIIIGSRWPRAFRALTAPWAYRSVLEGRAWTCLGFLR